MCSPSSQETLPTHVKSLQDRDQCSGKSSEKTSALPFSKKVFTSNILLSVESSKPLTYKPTTKMTTSIINSWIHPFVLGKHCVGKERSTKKILLICPVVLLPKATVSPHMRCMCGLCMHREHETHTTHTPWASVHSPGPDRRWRSKRQNSALEHYLCAIPLRRWANQWTLALQSADLPHKETVWTMSLWQGHQPFLVAACCTQCNPTANHAGCIEMSPGTEGTAPGPDKLL